MIFFPLTADDTIDPLTSLLPLLFVMIVTALKEGLEDYARSKSDKIVNTTKGEGFQVDFPDRFPRLTALSLLSILSHCDTPWQGTTHRFGVYSTW